MVPPGNDKAFLEQQIAETQALVAEGERMIDNQARLIAELTVAKRSTVDDDFTLEVMIQIHTAHVVYLRKLEDELDAVRD